jgi:hypothetical protein
LVLWLTGDLWNSQSNSYAGSSYSSSPSSGGTSPYGSGTTTGPTGTTGTGGMGPGGGSPPVSAAPGSAPTEESLLGSWGPECPGSRGDAVTFNADHTAIGTGEGGSWSLSGSTVTVTTSRQTLNLNWEMLDASTARVTRSGDSRARLIFRCP